MTVAADRAPSILVLGYHAISKTWPASLAVTPAQFRQQLEWLLARGYRAATLLEALTRKPSSPTLVVTFDDAYASVLELGYPILSSLGVPATVFVVTDFADQGRLLGWPGIEQWSGGEYEPELRGLEWSELEALVQAGWEIGSHTRTHPRLTQCTQAQLEEELRGSREACERALDRPCHLLAYPYGDADSRVVAAAKTTGYSAAVIDDVTRPRLHAWPRVGVYRENSMPVFRLKVFPPLRRVQATLGSAERRLARSIHTHG
jgi:peptidoglycan/xylan/chitin deacetylase (PgdA/CDA1 family)